MSRSKVRGRKRTGTGKNPGQKGRPRVLDVRTEDIGKIIRERQNQEGDPRCDNLFWPVPGFRRVTSGFGMRRHPVLNTRRMHTGIDISARAGAGIAAAEAGTVIYVGNHPVYGRVVIIDHGGGLATLYAHLSAISARVGDKVNGGDRIGAAGSTGLATGTHLHFEVRVNGEPVDPWPYLRHLPLLA